MDICDPNSGKEGHRQTDRPQRLLTSQPSLLGELQASKKCCLGDKEGGHQGRALASPLTLRGNKLKTLLKLALRQAVLQLSLSAR